MAGQTAYETLLYVSLAVLIGMTVLYLRTGRASFFHPVTVYLAFHAVVFVIRPLLAFYRGYDEIYAAFRFHPSWSDKITVLVGSNLGMIVFVLGALAFGKALPRMRDNRGELDQYIRPTLIAALICGVPAVWSLLDNFRIQAGLSENTMVMVKNTGIRVNTTSNGYFYDAQLMLPTLVGMIAYVFGFRWLSLVPLALYVFIQGSTGSRGAFIAAFFFMTALYLFSKRRAWFTSTSILLAGVGVMLFRLVGNDRGAGFRALLGLHSDPNPYTQRTRFLESMDYANMEFFEYLVYAIPQRTGTYDYFASLLQLFTEPIPRVLWPGKPVGAPITFYELWDYGTPIGMTLSMPGAGWTELGWIGIVVLALAFAWVYGKGYDRFMTSRQTPFAVMFYCAFFTTGMLAFRNGSLLTIVHEAAFYLVPIFVMKMVHRAYYPSGTDAGQATLPASAGQPTANVRKSPRQRRHERAAGSRSLSAP